MLLSTSSREAFCFWEEDLPDRELRGLVVLWLAEDQSDSERENAMFRCRCSFGAYM